MDMVGTVMAVMDTTVMAGMDMGMGMGMGMDTGMGTVTGMDTGMVMAGVGGMVAIGVMA
jgi:hypothetical protein